MRTLSASHTRISRINFLTFRVMWLPFDVSQKQKTWLFTLSNTNATKYKRKCNLCWIYAGNKNVIEKADGSAHCATIYTQLTTSQFFA